MVGKNFNHWKVWVKFNDELNPDEIAHLAVKAKNDHKSEKCPNAQRAKSVRKSQKKSSCSKIRKFFCLGKKEEKDSTIQTDATNSLTAKLLCTKEHSDNLVNNNNIDINNYSTEDAVADGSPLMTD